MKPDDWNLNFRFLNSQCQPVPLLRSRSQIEVTQYSLPQYFNQAYAAQFLYQLLLGIGTNFCGFGLAGLSRRFLVYPSYCVWPASLVTIALNQAFHSKEDHPVRGPFNRVYTWSRMKLFTVAFAAMFVWFWIVGFLFPALSTFNWISWIAPLNVNLNLITGSVNGLVSTSALETLPHSMADADIVRKGLNPWPTFDFNNLTAYGELLLP